MTRGCSPTIRHCSPAEGEFPGGGTGSCNPAEEPASAWPRACPPPLTRSPPGAVPPPLPRARPRLLEGPRFGGRNSGQRPGGGLTLAVFLGGINRAAVRGNSRGRQHQVREIKIRIFREVRGYAPRHTIAVPAFADRHERNRRISNAECRMQKSFRRFTVTGGQTAVPVLIQLGKHSFDILRLVIGHSAVLSGATVHRCSWQRMAPAERRASHEIPGRTKIKPSRERDGREGRKGACACWSSWDALSPDRRLAPCRSGKEVPDPDRAPCSSFRLQAALGPLFAPYLRGTVAQRSSLSDTTPSELPRRARRARRVRRWRLRIRQPSLATGGEVIVRRAGQKPPEGGTTNRSAQRQTPGEPLTGPLWGSPLVRASTAGGRKTSRA